MRVEVPALPPVLFACILISEGSDGAESHGQDRSGRGNGKAQRDEE